MITLCTLFNTNYIDKGLTMYESIDRYTHDYVLYVLCMDERCYEILSKLSMPRFIPIRLSDFETPTLLNLKKERTIGEYCWTCSSSLVDYVMKKDNPQYCAYIDSDLYFYDDVNLVINEMQNRNASVMIVGHRFHKFDEESMIWKVGRYCVEFNTFKNDDKGRALLAIWKNQCLEYCKCDGDGVHWGDQKYMDNWCQDYSFVVETNNLGAGVAPWNIAQYRLMTEDEYGPKTVLCTGRKYNMFFYHFQDLRYITPHKVFTNTENTWGISKSMINSVYIPYLKHLNQTKGLLEKRFGIKVLIKEHPGYKKAKTSLSHKLKVLLVVFSSKKGMRDLLNKTIPFCIYRRLGILEF